MKSSSFVSIKAAVYDDINSDLFAYLTWTRFPWSIKKNPFIRLSFIFVESKVFFILTYIV